MFSAVVGTHSLYSKKVSKLALVLLLNINDLFHGGIQSVLCSLRNPFFVFKKKYQNLSNLFEDSNTACVGIVALVLLLNPTPSEYRSLEMNSRDTYARFHGSKRSMFCSNQSLYRFILFLFAINRTHIYVINK